MNRKIRVGAVSYLNTKPLIFGIEKGMMKDAVDLVYDYPSKIAERLLNDEIDIGLIPVAALKDLDSKYILPRLCIGCDGEVGSVCLFSQVPIQEITTVLLDYQSRTSVELLKILIKDHWKIDPLIQHSKGEYRHQISSTTAGLVIGDRAFEQRLKSDYSYDLGAEWKKFTGLPFVFACWVSNEQLDQNFINDFISANEWGLQHLDEVVAANPYELFDLKKYYTEYISYLLDDEKIAGMNCFMELMNNNSKIGKLQ